MVEIEGGLVFSDGDRPVDGRSLERLAMTVAGEGESACSMGSAGAQKPEKRQRVGRK